MNNFDRNKLVKLLQDKKVQSYSFLVGFFVVFSFFVIFAIRPNLITAFNLQKELQDLKLQSREFESKIQQIVTYQTVLEQHRDDLPLLDEAVPSSPVLGKVIEEVRKSASDSGIILGYVSVESVDYKLQSESTQSFDITVDATASKENLRLFLDALLNQRRLKSLEIIDVLKPDFTEDPSNDINIYKVNLIVSSSYL